MTSTFSHLRWAVIGAVAIAACGGAAGYLGMTRHADAKRVYEAAQADFRETRARLDSVYGERQEIDSYLARYNNLRAIGALGNESRLDWIERLASIRDDLKLPRLAYTVGPRQPDPLFPDPSAGLLFEASTMKLEFVVLHEGDVIEIIRRLRSPPMGVFEVRNCAVSRRDARAVNVAAGSGGRLEGECQLEWIALTGAKAPEPAPREGS
ncbi:MAG: hypothetical protein JNM90_05040 [Burkholderiales bacterium]|nr:hypothetical protein [Burkholderiales bacterium]